MEQRQKLLDEITELRRNLSNENLQLMPEFQQRWKLTVLSWINHLLNDCSSHRVAVLRFLNYIDHQNAVQLKGRVAREVGSELNLHMVVYSSPLPVSRSCLRSTQ